MIKKYIKKYIRNGKLSIAFRFLLVFWDILCINLCSYLALYIGFDLKWKSIELESLTTIHHMLIINTVCTLMIFAVCRLYNSLWRFASIRELLNIVMACVATVIVHMLTILGTYQPIARRYFIIYAFLLFAATLLIRFSYRFMRLIYSSNFHGEGMRNTMIIGAGEACNMVMNELTMSNKLDSKIKCIIDDNKRKHNTYIHGVKVIGGRDRIVECVERYGIDEIIIAMPSVSKKNIRKIIEVCQKTDADLKILPGVYQLVNGEETLEKIRAVQIEDLLGREQVDVNLESIMGYVSGKTILVTGGGGSIGSELCRQIARNKPKQLIIFDIYENNAYDIQQELKHSFPCLDLVVLIGSVRNTERINSVFAAYKPQIVYHAAAHKHVPLMEDSPNEAIKNNVFGTYKTAIAADQYGAEKFVLISTDKAVNPVNIMGASKRICEMIVQAFNRRSYTDFVAVRFGNVLGSNGSVIPLFKKQIETGGPVTITHPDIIRYFMTVPEAVSLVLQAGSLAKGGEIFVLDMGEPMKIMDLAKNLIRLSGYTLGRDINIEITGLRPGEKLFEEMLMQEEGLKETENSLIHIGEPIEFKDEIFFDKLEELYEEAYRESNEMKQLVADLVPTYRIREEDKKRDKKILDSKLKEFKDIEVRHKWL